MARLFCSPNRPNRGQQETGWLSLDDGDNDLARFLRYLPAAFWSAYSDLSESVQSVDDLVNTLSAVDEPLIIILDDYQATGAEAEHSTVARLVHILPPHVHLVTASQADPSLPQGISPADRLPMRHDNELPMKPVVDYVLSLPEVDPDKLAAYGISGGGYLVPWAVTAEKRIRAIATCSMIIDFYKHFACGTQDREVRYAAEHAAPQADHPAPVLEV